MSHSVPLPVCDHNIVPGGREYKERIMQRNIGEILVFISIKAIQVIITQRVRYLEKQ